MYICICIYIYIYVYIYILYGMILRFKLGISLSALTIYIKKLIGKKLRSISLIFISGKGTIIYCRCTTLYPSCRREKRDKKVESHHASPENFSFIVFLSIVNRKGDSRLSS